jgi:hypothetical protein
VDDETAPRGGSEGDIRSLYYWSRTAFVILVIAGAMWVLLAAYRIYRGLTWYGRDWLSGSTAATSDMLAGVAFIGAGMVCFLLARWTRNDIVSVFSVRRYQVPREKLLVYTILALPFGFVVPGLLLALVNVKLSYPEFLPSSAEAYPEAMPGYVMVPEGALRQEVPVEVPEEQLVPGAAPRELAPLGFDEMPVTEEEAQPAPEFFGEVPAPPPTATPAPAPVGAGPTPPAIVEAVVEEVTGEGIPEEGIPEEEIPEVVGEVTVASYEEVTAPVAVEAVVEEVPAEGAVAAVVEEVPPGDEEDFELVEIEEPGEPEEGPRTIEEAHDQLLGKLLGK